MLLQGIEVTPDNLKDFSIDQLDNFLEDLEDRKGSKKESLLKQLILIEKTRKIRHEKEEALATRLSHEAIKMFKAEGITSVEDLLKHSDGAFICKMPEDY